MWLVLKRLAITLNWRRAALDKTRTLTPLREGERQTEIKMKSEGWRRAQTDTRPVVRAVKGSAEVYGPP